MPPSNNSINAVIVGANGAIGAALVTALSQRQDIDRIFASSRQPVEDLRENVTSMRIDYDDESSIASAAKLTTNNGPLHLVIVATGILHQSLDDSVVKPEKTWSAINPEQLSRLVAVNTIGPALVAKHFLPLLDRNQRSVFAALSARVGSISDNRLGGWYGYRASKSALNMIIKTLSIELARRNPQAICIGLHPGTVDSKLSAPYQGNVAAERLFSPEFSATQMLTVVDQISTEQSGRVLAWNGDEVPA